MLNVGKTHIEGRVVSYVVEYFTHTTPNAAKRAALNSQYAAHEWSELVFQPTVRFFVTDARKREGGVSDPSKRAKGSA